MDGMPPKLYIQSVQWSIFVHISELVLSKLCMVNFRSSKFCFSSLYILFNVSVGVLLLLLHNALSPNLEPLSLFVSQWAGRSLLSRWCGKIELFVLVSQLHICKTLQMSGGSRLTRAFGASVNGNK